MWSLGDDPAPQVEGWYFYAIQTKKAFMFKKRYTFERYIADCDKYGYKWLEDGRCCPKNAYMGVMVGHIKLPDLPDPFIGIPHDPKG
jgi:hypothetical protein